MGMNSLDNCPKCGKVFVKGFRSICPACYKAVEEEYQKVYDFLKKRENRQASIYEVSDATNVSVKQIREFIREGKLNLLVPNFAYPCDSCGENLIIQGYICEECKEKLDKDIRNSNINHGEKDKEGTKQPGSVGFLNRDR